MDRPVAKTVRYGIQSLTLMFTKRYEIFSWFPLPEQPFIISRVRFFKRFILKKKLAIQPKRNVELRTHGLSLLNSLAAHAR